jgi:hypothetical protein
MSASHKKAYVAINAMPEGLAKALLDLLVVDARFAAEERAYRASPEYRAKVDAQRAAAAQAAVLRITAINSLLDTERGALAEFEADRAALLGRKVSSRAERAERDEELTAVFESIAVTKAEIRRLTNSLKGSQS